MNNEEKILSLLAEMNGKIDRIEETLEEHTTALNELIQWTEEVAVVVRVPFAQPEDPLGLTKTM